MILLALWRYMEQRFKATNQAYWAVITLTARNDMVSLLKTVALAADVPTHAGGVVYRERGGEVQYLLIEASDTPDVWVLPKGHVEESESPRETAVREVREESAIWGRIRADLGRVSYPIRGTNVVVQFYLMQAAGRALRRRPDSFRRFVWLSLDKAVQRARHVESRGLLLLAQAECEVVRHLRDNEVLRFFCG